MARIMALIGLGIASVLVSACASRPPTHQTRTATQAARPPQLPQRPDADAFESPPLDADFTDRTDPGAEADVALLNGPCEPFLALLQVASLLDGGKRSDSWEVVEHSGVVSLDPEMLGQCSEAMARGLRRFRSAAVESEAHLVVGQISWLMTRAYQRDNRYCPPTPAPVPAAQADIGEQGYQARASDFSAPTWRCLGLDLQGERLHFQYAIDLPEGTRGRTFEVVAKGRPLNDGPMIEVKRVGMLSVDRSRIAVGATIRRQY
jgi:hypothetical protein